MIVGLCSTWKEGKLGEAAVRSLLTACNRVVVADGPIGEASCDVPDTDWRELQKTGKVLIHRGAWFTDAAKRTSMLNAAKLSGPVRWGVILDGDELLVDGSCLPEYFDALNPDALGFSLHLMELDGSCAYIPNRVLRLDEIKQWTLSSYSFELQTGVVVQRGNIPILQAGEPDTAEWIDTGDGIRQRRRPLAGEPHILHRSVLRSPARREVPRQHEAEAEAVAGLGLIREAMKR